MWAGSSMSRCLSNSARMYRRTSLRELACKPFVVRIMSRYNRMTFACCKNSFRPKLRRFITNRLFQCFFSSLSEW